MVDGECGRRHFVAAAGSLLFAVPIAGCLDDDGAEADDDAGDDDEDVEYIDEEPDYGDYLDDANLYEGRTVDWTGEGEVTVMNGAGDQGLAFDPPTIAVDPGTNVVWDWTGRGGAHTVTSNDELFDSAPAQAGEDITFEHTFEDTGVYLYHCIPHESVGQKGAVYVVE